MSDQSLGLFYCSALDERSQKVEEMRRTFLIALSVFAMAGGSAFAQQRTLNEDAPRLLRQWPQSGAWSVFLGRASGGDLFCAMVTGVPAQANGEAYFWGLRDRHKKLALVISDRNSQAVSGDAVRVYVDGASVGSFAVNRRLTVDGANSVAAELSPSELTRITNFFRLGGQIAFRTDVANYAASLQGAPVAFNNFAQCGLEADQLDSSRAGM